MKKKILTAAALILVAACGAVTVLTRVADGAGEPEAVETSTVATPAPTPAPTPKPTPEPTPEPRPEYFVFSFVGDCTLASSQHHKGASFAFESVVGEDYDYPFAKTIQFLDNDYMSVANLEGTFTNSTESNGGTFVFKSDPAYARILSQGGIEAVTLGNNHGGDFGSRGREDTMAALSEVGVAYAADNDWCIYESDGGPKVGLYSKLYPTVSDVTAGVEALKEAGAELIIAGLHWGFEGSYRVTADQEAVGRAAIDAGAMIVYGSHPHVLHRTEDYNGGCILYSLGNWSFGGNTAPRDRDTAIIRVTVMRDVDGTLSYTGMELIPCELSSTPGINDYQPHPYPEDCPEYERAMSKLRGTFDGPDLTIDYSAFH